MAWARARVGSYEVPQNGQRKAVHLVKVRESDVRNAAIPLEDVKDQALPLSEVLKIAAHNGCPRTAALPLLRFSSTGSSSMTS